MLARNTALFLLALSLAAPSMAEAQEQIIEPDGDVATPDLSFGSAPTRTFFFTALIGGISRPAYVGSDELKFGPQFKLNIGFLNFAGLRFGDTQIEDPLTRNQGFGVRGSFRYLRGRDSDEFDELDGLDDLDPTLEVGIAAGYVWQNAEAYAEIRYGLGGHDSWVGELGANYVGRPTDRLVVRAGPRVFFGAENYANTYFSVSEDEAANSDFEAFDADGGLMSAGVEVIASYRLSDRWWLEGGARWDQFQGDAADSPIVQDVGSRNQTEIRLGVRRAFVLEF